MSLIRSLFVLSFASLSLGIFSSASYAQPAPQPPFWPFIQYWPLPQFWAAQPTMPAQAIPFPTPFWLWPMPPRNDPPMPVQPAAALSVSLPSPTPIPEPLKPPSQQPIQEPPAAISAPPPPPTLPNEARAAAPVIDGKIETFDSAAPVSAIVTPPEKSIEAAPQTAAKPKLVKKSRVATKPLKKLRKLCWKDGRLDVCP